MKYAYSMHIIFVFGWNSPIPNDFCWIDERSYCGFSGTNQLYYHETKIFFSTNHFFIRFLFSTKIFYSSFLMEDFTGGMHNILFSLNIKTDKVIFFFSVIFE